MKRLDFFRKPKQDLEKTTCSGCFLTFITFAIIAYLVIAEYCDYASTSLISKEFTVKSGFDNANSFVIDFNITFMQMPCSAFLITKKDLTGLDETSARFNIQYRLSEKNETIEKDYVDEKNLPEDFKNSSLEIQKIVTGIINKEKCNVRGTIIANKIPGKIIFDYSLKKDSLKTIRLADYKLYDKINFSHFIERLQFLGATKAFDEKKDIGLNSLSYMEVSHELPFSCSYYLKVIPVTRNTDLEEETNDYQYSYHFNCEVMFK